MDCFCSQVVVQNGMMYLPMSWQSKLYSMVRVEWPEDIHFARGQVEQPPYPTPVPFLGVCVKADDNIFSFLLFVTMFYTVTKDDLINGHQETLFINCFI